MSSSVFSSCSLRGVAIGLALLLAPLAALADPNNTGTVNCGDPNTKDACIECCTTPTCIGKIFCCPLVGSCTIVNNASGGGSFPPLKLNVIVGGLKLQFQSTLPPCIPCCPCCVPPCGPGGQSASAPHADVKLKMTFLPKVFPKGVSFKAHLTGMDAGIGGLLYPIAFLGIGDGALSMLQAHGYDVTVDEGSLPTCQAMFPAQACTDLANMLSKSIDGALGMGIRSELDAFEAGAQAIGYAPCPIIIP